MGLACHVKKLLSFPLQYEHFKQVSGLKVASEYLLVMSDLLLTCKFYMFNFKKIEI